MEIQQNMYPPMKKVPQAPIKEVEALLLGSKVLPDGITYLKPFDTGCLVLVPESFRGGVIHWQSPVWQARILVCVSVCMCVCVSVCMCVCVSVCMYVCARVESESEQSFHLATKLDPLFCGSLHQN